MIKKIKLTNFKSFKDVTIDFTGANGVPKKSIFIYGENGSGKSNIVSSIVFLQYTISSLLAAQEIEKVINSDTNNLTIKNYEGLRTRLNCNIEQLVSNYKLIDSNENMKLHYELIINNKTAEYDIEFDDKGIVYESLYYPIFKNKVLIYEVKNIDEVFISDNLFKD
ncbi:MAG: AAA family ATPase, partial [Bacilli bacterium]